MDSPSLPAPAGQTNFSWRAGNLNGRFLDYEQFRDEASQVGLRTEFTEMPYQKYMEMLNKDYYSR